MISDEELDRIERRESLAAPSPWQIMDLRCPALNEIHISSADEDDSFIAVVYTDVKDENPKDLWNAEFIANAREDIPKLIKEIRRLRRLVNQ